MMKPSSVLKVFVYRYGLEGKSGFAMLAMLSCPLRSCWVVKDALIFRSALTGAKIEIDIL